MNWLLDWALNLNYASLLKGLVMTLAIAATMLNVFGLLNEWATREGRKPEYVLLLRVSTLFGYAILPTLIVLDTTLALRSTVIGFSGAAVLSLVNYLFVYAVIFGHGVMIVVYSEMAQDVDPRSAIIDEEIRKRSRELALKEARRL